MIKINKDNIYTTIFILIGVAFLIDTIYGVIHINHTIELAMAGFIGAMEFSKLRSEMSGKLYKLAWISLIIICLSLSCYFTIFNQEGDYYNRIVFGASGIMLILADLYYRKKI